MPKTSYFFLDTELHFTSCLQCFSDVYTKWYWITLMVKNSSHMMIVRKFCSHFALIYERIYGHLWRIKKSEMMMSSGSVSHTEWHHHVLCVCVFTCDPVMTEGGKLEGRVHLYKCFCAAGLGRSSSGCQRQHLDSSKRHGRYLQHTHTHTHTQSTCVAAEAVIEQFLSQQERNVWWAESHLATRSFQVSRQWLQSEWWRQKSPCYTWPHCWHHPGD